MKFEVGWKIMEKDSEGMSVNGGGEKKEDGGAVRESDVNDFWRKCLSRSLAHIAYN